MKHNNSFHINNPSKVEGYMMVNMFTHLKHSKFFIVLMFNSDKKKT